MFLLCLVVSGLCFARVGQCFGRGWLRLGCVLQMWVVCLLCLAVCVVCFVIEFCGCPKEFEKKKRNRLINDDLTINSLTNGQMEGKQLTLDRDNNSFSILYRSNDEE